MIAGSRSVSTWLNMAPAKLPEQYLEGSPFDRAVYTGLLVAGLLILYRRHKEVLRLLRANWPLILFVFYCAVSIVWSDFPEVAVKRWIKSLGDYAMILIVLTDPEPIAALKRVLARAGFLLLPLSVLLIKYYPDVGRGYPAHWEGTAYYVGVAADKNMLGMACLVFGLASWWRFLQEFRRQKKERRRGPLIAHGVIVGMTVWLFWMANSMTSLGCFVMASSLIVATSSPWIARRRMLVHVFVACVLSFLFCVLFLNVGSFLLTAVGRNPTLTGRTDLWANLIELTANPLLGAGFESFWLGPRLEKLWSIYWWQPNESHNGYLEVYLNLGWFGIALFAGAVVAGYRNAIGLLKTDPDSGRLRLAYLVVGLAYNLTEAAIRTMDLMWLAFLIALISVPKASAVQETLQNVVLATDSQAKSLNTVEEEIPAWR
ncbi:MAG TPA: O-antigen ligase family protein [Candidatus Acidoferrum sp.]|nr:O-antigen ligase family protein [Candidatus Acidoferrum sp.]